MLVRCQQHARRQSSVDVEIWKEWDQHWLLYSRKVLEVTIVRSCSYMRAFVVLASTTPLLLSVMVGFAVIVQVIGGGSGHGLPVMAVAMCMGA